MAKRKSIDDENMQEHFLFATFVQIQFVSYLEDCKELACLRLVCKRWSTLCFPRLQVKIKRLLPMKKANCLIATVPTLILENNTKSTQKLFQLVRYGKKVNHLIIVDHRSTPKRSILDLSKSEISTLTLRGCSYNGIHYPPNLLSLHFNSPSARCIRHQEWPHQKFPHLQHLIVKSPIFVLIKNHLGKWYPSLQTMTIQFASKSWDDLRLVLEISLEHAALPLNLLFVCETWDVNFCKLQKSEWFIVTENGLRHYSPNSAKAASPISL